jgi:Arc/MetJ-type ribon-helix-helix transcriptional regulator
MRIRLSSVHERSVRRKLAAGEFNSTDEVVAQALIALRREDDLRRENDVGLADIRAGRVSDWNPEDAKQELLRRISSNRHEPF